MAFISLIIKPPIIMLLLKVSYVHTRLLLQAKCYVEEHLCHCEVQVGTYASMYDNDDMMP